MTIRNIVPRNNNEGQLGTENKKWNKIYTNEIFATNFTGNLTGTADNAIKDNKSQQIDATYIKNISINNDTLTVTKGNDDSQDITINNISHAISSDNAINANKLQELTAGNSKGQIPINNGIENVNLNAALLNGKASSYFATSNHTHTTATQSSNGYMSNADKKKLDGIASGAEINQNAFANVKVGSTTISSDAKQDTLELVAGTNISLVGDANNDKVTIGVTGKVASATTADKVNGIASDGGSLELVRGTMAGSDSFRIKIGGSNDVGYAEIATADNGNEPIYVRQYGSGFTTATRTATILDSNGNTSFPGTVTAPNFNGKATKATQDKNGKDITGYLYKTEDLTLNSNAEILTVGNISEILNSFCTKFKQIQGADTYAENSPTSIKSLNDNKAPKANPAFSGTPTSPTPATSDNSTKIATTEFVRNLINQFKNDGTLGGIVGGIVGGSLTQNGWVKFSNGLILQWGRSTKTSVTFPIAFPNNCFTAIGMLVRASKGEVSMNQPTTTGVKFNSYENPWNWIAIGN